MLDLLPIALEKTFLAEMDETESELKIEVYNQGRKEHFDCETGKACGIKQAD